MRTSSSEHDAAERGLAADETGYNAFISYSHYDQEAVGRLHRRLEHYRIPSRIVRSHGTRKTLQPIFLDRADYRSAGNYAAETSRTLQRSRALIVVCTPHAARSAAVDDEIVRFKRLGREQWIFPIILSGEPNATVRGEAEDECFPPSLRFALDADGQLTDQPINPIAADARPRGDGPTDAFLKLVAGLLEVPFDEFKRRHIQAKRRRRIGWGMAAVGILVVVAAGLFASDTVSGRVSSLRSASLAAASGQYDEAGRLAFASLGPRGSLVPWSPAGVDGIFLEAGARSGVMVRGGGCAPEDIAPDQPCFAGRIEPSADGRTVAVVAGSRTIRVVTVGTGGVVAEITASGTDVQYLALSASGALLVVADAEGLVEVFRIADATPIASRRFAADDIKAVAFAAPERLVVVRRGGAVQVRREGAALVDEASVDLASFLTATLSESGRWLLVRRTGGSELVGPFAADAPPAARPLAVSGRVARWAFSSDGSLLAAAVNDSLGNRVYVIEAGFVRPAFPARHSLVTALGLSGDGRLLVTGGIDRRIRLWQRDGASPIAELDVPFEKAGWTGISRDGAYVAAFDERDDNAGTLYAWQVAEPSRRLALRGHVRTIRQAFFGADGRLVTAADDASIRFWDLPKAFATLELLERDPAAARAAICAEPTGPYAAYARDESKRQSGVCESGSVVSLRAILPF